MPLLDLRKKILNAYPLQGSPLTESLILSYFSHFVFKKCHLLSPKLKIPKLVVIRNKILVASHGYGIKLPISYAAMITDSVVADPGFPRRGVQIYYFRQFFLKVHENEPK